MENGTTHANGKSHVTSLVSSRATLIGHAPASKYDKVLDLVKEAVHLEFRYKETMGELAKEMREMGHTDLPSVLMSFVHTHNNTQPRAPTVVKARPPASYNNKGGALKARILGLMSDKRERRSNLIVAALKSKSPTSVYTILTSLVKEGHLIRTKYAHYRLKLRNGK